jgi:hypothetical protein
MPTLNRDTPVDPNSRELFFMTRLSDAIDCSSNYNSF